MIDETRFAGAAQLAQWCDRLGGFGLRSSGSAAHDAAIDWIEAELRAIPGLAIRDDRFEIARWHAEAGLAQAGGLRVAGQPVPIAGVVPYSCPASRSGALMHLPPDVAVRDAQVQGRVIVRAFPDQPVPYRALMQGSLFSSPDCAELEAAVYDRPGMADAVIHRDLIEAGLAGAAGMIVCFDLPREQVAGYFEPHQGTQYRLPAVFAGAEEKAWLMQAAAESREATLDVRAVSDRASTRNLFATLPGQTAERVVLVSHTDGNTWVQENGAAALLGLAHYFSSLPLAERRRTIEFAFTSTHLHISREGSVRYANGLDQHFDDGDLAFVLAIEHLGARELVPVGNPQGAGRRLAFTGAAEPLLWAVGPSEAMRRAVVAAVRGRDLARTFVVPGLGPAVAGHVPEYASFGGIGTNFHARLLPTTSLITGPWSLWAPSFGRDAIDIDLLRRQTLAAGDVVTLLDHASRDAITGGYLANRAARKAGAPGGPRTLSPEFAP